MQQGFYMDPATLKIKPWSTFRTLLKLMLEYSKERATILNFNQKKKKKKAWVLELPCLHPLTSASTPRLHPSSCVLFPPPTSSCPFYTDFPSLCYSPRPPHLAPTGELLSDKRRRCSQYATSSDENKEAFKSISFLFNPASHHAHMPRSQTLENI